MEMETAKKVSEEKKKLYPKEAFKRDKKYNPDIICALLEDGEFYTRQEVTSMIDRFLKGM